ncbi:uncharacterized protein LOC126904843 [Daktulosphaira vitifoliae]|uniref:uncharacterized protein LOC126904843 n=1 Tax=Daktulosphaira vitifoliae TaxID=58002 RepID=UPI0021AAAFE0|nr:uncharacterized protein LOC126904843 [Daktulosphaira vitifoliae]
MVFIKSLISCSFVIFFIECNSMENSREDLIQEATHQIKLTNILLEKAINDTDENQKFKTKLKNRFIVAVENFHGIRSSKNGAEIIFPSKENELKCESDKDIQRNAYVERTFREHLFCNVKQNLPEDDVSKLSYNDEVEKRFALIKELVEDMLLEDFHATKLCENGSVVKCALKAYIDYISNPLIIKQYVKCMDNVCHVEYYAMRNENDQNLDNLIRKKYTIQDSAQDIEIMSQHPYN